MGQGGSKPEDIQKIAQTPTSFKPPLGPPNPVSEGSAPGSRSAFQLRGWDAQKRWRHAVVTTTAAWLPAWGCPCTRT